MFNETEYTDTRTEQTLNKQMHAQAERTNEGIRIVNRSEIRRWQQSFADSISQSVWISMGSVKQISTITWTLCDVIFRTHRMRQDYKPSSPLFLIF